MSNLTLPPEAIRPATSHPVGGQRLGGASGGIPVVSPAPLLPSDPPPTDVPQPAPTRALARDAIELLPRLVDPTRRPPRWSHPRFGREVEEVRRHLMAIRSQGALADSYGREATLDPVAAERDDPGPIRIAYALRWLELRDGTVGPTWPAMMGPCG